MTRNAIQTIALTKVFDKKTAVNGLTLEIPEGTCFGLFGPLGAGKSTTIHILLGLLTPSAGIARIMGFDCVRESQQARERCGVMLENDGLYQRLSIMENLEFYARVWNLSAAERASNIRLSLKALDLWEKRDVPVMELPMIERQKTALARAMINEPEVLILDDPTKFLTRDEKIEFWDTCENFINRENSTVLISSQDIREIERLCSCAAIIRSGQIISHGQPQEIRKKMCGLQLEVYGRNFNADVISTLKTFPNVEHIALHQNHLTLTLARKIDTAPLINYLVRQGIDVDEVRKSNTIMEEISLELVDHV